VPHGFLAAAALLQEGIRFDGPIGDLLTMGAEVCAQRIGKRLDGLFLDCPVRGQTPGVQPCRHHRQRDPQRRSRSSTRAHCRRIFP
jgi:hypothetical protein